MFSPVSTKRFLTVDDCQRHGSDVRVTCVRCGHSRDYHPFPFMMLFHPKPPNWLFETVGKRVRCSRCGARGGHVRPAIASWRAR